MDGIYKFLTATENVLEDLDRSSIRMLIEHLVQVRNRRGRVFVLGVGGSAANASHAVNDLRKILGIEAYAPTDNVAELTARTNDQGWDTTFDNWCVTSRIRKEDAILILSVGGGSWETSPNIVAAIDAAKFYDAMVLGIVSRDGGYTAKNADCCVVIPPMEPYITPLAESFQSLILHLVVSHPRFTVEQRKAVFFDRDGVLCQDTSPNPEDLIVYASASDLHCLKMLGFMLFVVTNQAGVPRGYQTKENVEEVNQLLRTQLPLDDIFVCYHDTHEGCYCRKPKPGMLFQAAQLYNIDLSKSFMIGDRPTDVAAGRRAGCTSFMLDGFLTLPQIITYITEKYESTL